MSYKRILCVGLQDNYLTLVMRVLLEKRSSYNIVSSVGMDDYARNEIPSSEAVKNFALKHGRILTSQNPVHPSLVRDAMAQGKTPFPHKPRHISVIKNFIPFTMIITPYRSVYARIVEIPEIDVSRVTLVDGIHSNLNFQEACSVLEKWAIKNF